MASLRFFAALLLLILAALALLYLGSRPGSLPRPPKGAILVRIEEALPAQPRVVGGDAVWKW